MKILLLLSITLSISFCTQGKKTDERDCEVCHKFMERIEKHLKENEVSDPKKIESEITKLCKKVVDIKENKLCYYIGGLEESATSVLAELAKPLSYGKPPKKICDALRKTDEQICELRYEKELDWKNINLKKMKVKELKSILAKWGDNCKGCVEKSDYVKRIEELKPKYVREEL